MTKKTEEESENLQISEERKRSNMFPALYVVGLVSFLLLGLFLGNILFEKRIESKLIIPKGYSGVFVPLEQPESLVIVYDLKNQEQRLLALNSQAYFTKKMKGG